MEGKMKFNLKKIVTSLLMLSILGVFETSKVDAAEVNTSRSESSVSVNQYTPSRIWITLGAYDNSPTHYFEYNGYRGYLSRVTRERIVGRGSMTFYRGYLYSRNVRSIPTPYSRNPQLLKNVLSLEDK
jgi:hypothetical protein